MLERPVFERLLCAQCWEDPELDFQALDVRPEPVLLALRPVEPGCRRIY